MGILLLFGQKNISYDIDATLDKVQMKLVIKQKIVFDHDFDSEWLYFTDWSNAYSSSQTPLAQRLVEEYDRSFYLSNKSKLGRTAISSFRVNGKEVQWKRLKNQADIIQVERDKKQSSTTTVEVDYDVFLPDAKFTGYGYDSNGSIYLRYWYIALSPHFNQQWRNYSHLNLDDYSIQAADYDLKLSVPNTQMVESSLKKIQTTDSSHYFSGKNNREVSVLLTQSDQYDEFQAQRSRQVITDIFKQTEDKEAVKRKVQKVDAFVTNAFNHLGTEKFIVPELLYKKNPFFSLNDLPKFLAPFNSEFLEEISFLKSYLHLYLNDNLPIDLRKDHWLVGGLQTYLMIKYIETYYPQEKYLGRLSRFKLVKAYTLANIDFNENFWMYYELMERVNLHQSDFLPKDQLIKFNEKIGAPNHVGIGLRYLEHYNGEEFLLKVFKTYLNQPNHTLSFIQLLKKHSPNDIDWFEDFYLRERTPIDLRIHKIKKRKDTIAFNISRYADNEIPFVLAQVKNDSIISQQWMEEIGSSAQVKLKNLNPDYIVINPEIRLPESNKVNNWRYTQNIFNLKPIHFNFLKDYQSPKRNQVFYNPVFNYNLYDGISVGARLYNKGLLTQKFTFELAPEYSSIEKKLVGKVIASLRLNNGNQKNYATIINFFGRSYHYDQNLQYNLITPSINFLFRTDDFRSNKGSKIGLYYYNVRRDRPEGSLNLSPDYELFNLRYLYSDRGALKHTTFSSNVQWSNKFSKLEMKFDFRRLFASGSQFTARVFAGKFIHHNQRETQYFDFNLDRPTDYLFQYNYFGRSETTGIFSQQIVMAEGGFKSKLSPATANDFLITTNLTLGLWKWVDVYADFGIVKNQGAPSEFLHGSGIRLNFLPDYLEIFFPLYSSNGWEINDIPYESKIRFIVSLNPDKLFQLFSRKWF